MDNFTPKPKINTYFKTVYYYDKTKDSNYSSTSGIKRKRDDSSVTSNTHSQLSSHSTVYSSDTPKHH